MDHRLTGQSVFIDGEHSVLLCGRMHIVSDGKGRSEILLQSLDGSDEEELVFTAGSTWVPVYQLIQVIREAFDVSPSPASSAPSIAATCQTCAGEGGNTDRDGNWQDCPDCT